MAEILIPLTFEDLPVKPPITGRPRISEDIQQTAALLVGWDKSTRRLVAVNPQGILHTAQAMAKGTIRFQATGDFDTWQGSDIKTSEVLIKAKEDNVGIINLNIGAAAELAVGYPLDSGEWVTISVNNLNSIHLHFRKDNDWVYMFYTK